MTRASHPLRHAGTALLRITLLVLGLLIALLYFRLGYFLIPILTLGAAVAVLVTSPQWRAGRLPAVGAVLVILTYAGITWLAWSTLVDREVTRTFSMRWESRGSDNGHGETELVLAFVAFPTHHVGVYSDELHQYLARRGENPVDAAFVVTRDLGWCTRGFRLARVGDLRSWKSAWSYSGSRGDGPSPWRRPWWCP
jgi:hypothetical protein